MGRRGREVEGGLGGRICIVKLVVVKIEDNMHVEKTLRCEVY